MNKHDVLCSNASSTINTDNPKLYSVNQNRESIGDIEYWQELCPKLSIGDGELLREAVAFELHEDEIQRLKGQMLHDGFFTLHSDALPWAMDVRDIAAGMERLKEQGWHPNFIMMYDQPWLLAQQLSKAMLQITGNTHNFDWLAYHIEPPDGAGIPPHRDFMHCPPESWHDDGSPKVVTVWVSLGNAGPLNSCLHILPASRDPLYRAGKATETPHEVIPTDAAFQDIMAVPLGPGSLVAFSHRLYHWGSASTPYAAEPRVSIAFGVSHTSFKRPYLPERHLPLPPFHIRLALTCGQMLIYNKRDEGPWPLTTDYRLDLELINTLLRVFMSHAVQFDETFAQTVLNSPIVKKLAGYRPQANAVLMEL